MVARRWGYAGERLGNKPSAAEKARVSATCERLIVEVLTPRFLPEIRPTAFNYPVAITGKWHGNRYRFITRYRSDNPSAIAPRFDAPFARLGYVGPDRFDLCWHRHTGEWHCVRESVSLAEALHLIETEEYFQPC